MSPAELRDIVYRFDKHPTRVLNSSKPASHLAIARMLMVLPPKSEAVYLGPSASLPLREFPSGVEEGIEGQLGLRREYDTGRCGSGSSYSGVVQPRQTMSCLLNQMRRGRKSRQGFGWRTRTPASVCKLYKTSPTYLGYSGGW
ncbi:hypothetical protein C8J57DRAFT_1458940 [Mycena rebaudengoi]|nr:hypothetical protein C8J57DRAFT_1458940 [Mycena rebaudengoi]